MRLENPPPRTVYKLILSCPIDIFINFPLLTWVNQVTRSTSLVNYFHPAPFFGANLGLIFQKCVIRKGCFSLSITAKRIGWKTKDMSMSVVRHGLTIKWTGKSNNGIRGCSAPFEKVPTNRTNQPFIVLYHPAIHVIHPPSPVRHSQKNRHFSTDTHPYIYSHHKEAVLSHSSG